jgi:DNA-binding response OmpR family regulator
MSMSKKRILLIDDDPSFTRLLKLNLEETGAYEVRVENRGTTALTAARQFKPDLILLDVIMPDMSGLGVASQIEANRNLKNTPIVFLTAMEKKEDQGTIAGRAFIAKPVTVEEVNDCIEEHLGRIPKSPTSPVLTGLRHLAIPVLAIFLAGAGFFGYKLITRSQQSQQETFKELQKTTNDLSSLRRSATKATQIQENKIHEQGMKLAAKDNSLNKTEAIEALLQKRLKNTQESKASKSTNSRLSGSILSKLAPSVVKIYCLANSFNDKIQMGSGFLYRATPSSRQFPAYYIQTNLHVVEKTDDSISKCRGVLYPNYADGSSYLLFKSEGYSFYRENIDVAILEPELMKDNVHVPVGTLKNLLAYARSEAETPVCDSVNIGEHLSVLGYPSIGGKTLTVTEDTVAGFEFRRGIRYIKTSAKIDPGISGGVAIKDSGCLVGLPTVVRRSRLGMPTLVRRSQAMDTGRILDLNYLFKVTLK